MFNQYTSFVGISRGALQRGGNVDGSSRTSSRATAASSVDSAHERPHSSARTASGASDAHHSSKKSSSYAHIEKHVSHSDHKPSKDTPSSSGTGHSATAAGVGGSAAALHPLSILGEGGASRHHHPAYGSKASGPGGSDKAGSTSKNIHHSSSSTTTSSAATTTAVSSSKHQSSHETDSHHSSSSHDSTWILGTKYAVNQSERVRKHVQSLIRLTYRSKMPPLRPYLDITSDSGWGCMLRTAQMLLAQALTRHALGKDWRIPSGHSARRAIPEYVEIVRWFLDYPGPSHLFAIQHLIQCGMKYDKLPGEWYGPSTAAFVIKDLVSMHRRMYRGQMEVYVGQDAMVYTSEVHSLCCTPIARGDSGGNLTAGSRSPRASVTSASETSPRAGAEVESREAKNNAGVTTQVPSKASPPEDPDDDAAFQNAIEGPDDTSVSQSHSNSTIMPNKSNMTISSVPMPVHAPNASVSREEAVPSFPDPLLYTSTPLSSTTPASATTMTSTTRGTSSMPASTSPHPSPTTTVGSSFDPLATSSSSSVSVAPPVGLPPKPWAAALLLIIPVRLGKDRTSPDTFEALKSFFRSRYCVGMLGGWVNHAVYFVGYRNLYELVGLDPHVTFPCPAPWNPVTAPEAFPSQDLMAQLHVESLQSMNLSQLDPSAALAFYFKDREEFDAFCRDKRDSERSADYKKRYFSLFGMMDLPPHLRDDDDFGDPFVLRYKARSNETLHSNSTAATASGGTSAVKSSVSFSSADSVDSMDASPPPPRDNSEAIATLNAASSSASTAITSANSAPIADNSAAHVTPPKGQRQGQAAAVDGPEDEDEEYVML